MHDPKNCCKTPLCIVYTSTLKDSSNNESRKDSQFAFGVGHYSAVIGVDYKSSTQYNSMSTSEKDQEWIGCFPVVNANSRVLPLRYCFPFDQDTTLSFRKNNNASDQLLRSYLIIRECSLSSDTRKKVPVALSFNPDDPNNSLTNVGSIRDMGSTSSFVSKSKQQFFGKVLDSKRSELDLLRAKIREIEVNRFLLFGVILVGTNVTNSRRYP